MDQILLVQPEEALAILISALLAIGAGYLEAPITTVLTNGLKLFPFLKDVGAPLMRTVIALVLTVITWIAAATGLNIQLNTVLELIAVAGPILFQLLANISGSGQIHRIAVKHGDEHLFGYSRTPQLQG